MRKKKKNQLAGSLLIFILVRNLLVCIVKPVIDKSLLQQLVSYFTSGCNTPMTSLILKEKQNNLSDSHFPCCLLKRQTNKL